MHGQQLCEYAGIKGRSTYSTLHLQVPRGSTGIQQFIYSCQKAGFKLAKKVSSFSRLDLCSLGNIGISRKVRLGIVTQCRALINHTVENLEGVLQFVSRSSQLQYVTRLSTVLQGSPLCYKLSTVFLCSFVNIFCSFQELKSFEFVAGL